MEIFITKNDQRLGPYTVAEVKKLLATGEIQENEWAWYDGVADWIPLNQVPGFALPSPSPLLTASPETAPAPKDSSLLIKRLATALILFFIGFAVLFVVIFVLAIFIGGAMSGAQASVAAHAQDYNEGSRIGAEAGRKFGEQYTGMIAGIDALFSSIVSATIAFWVAFSELLPWCRTKRNL